MAEAASGPTKVVFACVANAGRSQMAAALFNQLADPARALAVSAGTRPATAIHPEAVAVMLETGIDLSQARPQHLSADLCRDARIIITMGCGDECPVIAGVERDDWPVEDPSEKPIDEVRRIRDRIEKRVTELIWERNWSKVQSPESQSQESRVQSRESRVQSLDIKDGHAMSDAELVAVRTFPNRIEAELARSALDAAGIDSMVAADDAGGTQSGLWLARGVRLLVRVEDVSRADEVLRE